MKKINVFSAVKKFYLKTVLENYYNSYKIPLVINVISYLSLLSSGTLDSTRCWTSHPWHGLSYS